MIGAVIDSAGIVAGGVCALACKKTLPARYQLAAKLGLGIFTVWLGLGLTWKSLNGTFTQILKELGIALLAMLLGKWVGQLLRLQKLSNSIGQYASRALTAQGGGKRFNDGFLVATGLFCAAPLAFLASVQEGLNSSSFSPVFLIKAGTDGLATMAFCVTFGWGSLISAIPALAFQGGIIRSAQWMEPWLSRQPWPLVDSINAVNGLLIFCVALIILEIKKVRVADYLPGLVLAPLLTRWLW
jgi:uncharacterized membrane protein YqgA involved in biofilm formation